MPDLHDLDHFDQGLPRMDTLPASEIRRRGDRLRRRRTALATAGGVLAAAVAIGTPVLALAGDGPGRGTEPSFATQPATTQPATTTPRTEPAGGWTTTVRDDFPLTAGFADEQARTSHSLDGDPAVPAGCQTSFDGYTDSLVATYQGTDSEDRGVRILAVYPDAAAAENQLAAVRSAVEACEPRKLNQGTTMVHGLVGDVGLGTEEAFAVTEQVQHDDGLLSDLSISVIGRTGNAVYVDYSFGSAGGDQVSTAEIARLVATSAEPVAALCTFSVDGC
ncbi:hypothetical protein G5V58_16480 [Nocardioides anomalus]|uniref:Sensor domain-containing protein n=1 Tax=Nocardioides anomalus TaxID=2712223 RepID=A0A6G6W7P5_9ACTN|nr:hypothetical protein [Nocardioides anomalus]QIG41358.1 hypothetical protein G5V58_16480 [Nocardioides anomalus]